MTKFDVFKKELREDIVYFEINYDLVPANKVYYWLGIDLAYHGLGDLKFNLKSLGVRYKIVEV